MTVEITRGEHGTEVLRKSIITLVRVKRPCTPFNTRRGGNVKPSKNERTSKKRGG